MRPAALCPDRIGPRRADPPSGYPYVAADPPIVISVDPHVAGRRRRGHCTVRPGRRRGIRSAPNIVNASTAGHGGASQDSTKNEFLDRRIHLVFLVSWRVSVHVCGHLAMLLKMSLLEAGGSAGARDIRLISAEVIDIKHHQRTLEVQKRGYGRVRTLTAEAALRATTRPRRAPARNQP